MKLLRPLMFATGAVGIVVSLGIAIGLVMYLVFLLLISALGDWGSG